jgi:hypothetical protein
MFSHYLLLLVSAVISGSFAIMGEDPSPYAADKRASGKNDREIFTRPVPCASFLPSATGIGTDRPDSATVPSKETGSGIVRAHAWNPGLHRYNSTERRMKMFGYRSDVVAGVLQEHNGTSTRMRERGTREGIQLPHNIREYRNDMPRFSQISGDGRDKTQAQYFTGCSDGCENNDCTAPGITPAVMTHSGCTGLPAFSITMGPPATRPGFSESFASAVLQTGGFGFQDIMI